jgi:protein-(glutamine-N5) methyltransferase, release factor-specific
MLQTTIKDWLDSTEEQLKQSGIDSFVLDGELLISDEIGCDRTYIHSHLDDLLDEDAKNRADMKLTRRLSREPLAYIRGFKEFYGRDFLVTPGVLIPRPESEEIVDIVKAIGFSGEKKIVDVGTGSGVLGITVKLEIPDAIVSLVDISDAALRIAEANANKLSADVTLVCGDLLEGVNEKVDVVIANLPYVDRGWQVSPETKYEPDSALFAEDGGLELIKRLVRQSADKLSCGGILILEADIRQHREIIDFAEGDFFELYHSGGLVLAFAYRP